MSQSSPPSADTEPIGTGSGLSFTTGDETLLPVAEKSEGPPVRSALGLGGADGLAWGPVAVRIAAGGAEADVGGC